MVHVHDASRVVGVVSQLLNPQTRDAFAAQVAAEQEQRRRLRAQARAAAAGLRQARANRLAVDWASGAHRAARVPGHPEAGAAAAGALVPYIDWTPFFQVWELRGRYPEILDDARLGVEARRVVRRTRRRCSTDIVHYRRFEARAVYGFFPANSDGDDVVVYADESRSAVRAVLHTLRQQIRKGNDGPNLALADYVAPADSGRLDYVGGFAVTAGLGADALVRHFQGRGDDYSGDPGGGPGRPAGRGRREYLHAAGAARSGATGGTSG